MKISYFLNASVVALAATLAGCGAGDGGKTDAIVSSSLNNSSSSSLSSSLNNSSINPLSSSLNNSSSSSLSSSGSDDLEERIINGGLEDDETDATQLTGGWALFDSKEGLDAIATIKVVESAEGENTHTGTKAIGATVEQVGNQPWAIEIAYEDILVEPLAQYEVLFWTKGPAGASINVSVGTPAPTFTQRSSVSVTLTGDWQEIKLAVVATSTDNLLRLATHLSYVENEGLDIYFDDLSFKRLGEIDHTEVTATSLKALSPNGMPIGVAVPAGAGFGNNILNSTDRQTVVTQHFSQLTAENIMKPLYMHPAQDTYTFGDADDLVQFAKDNDMTVHGHVFIWYNQIASWMENFNGTRDEWITMLEEHVTTVATHFEEEGDNDTVTSWDVVNEAFMEDGTYRGEAGTGTSVWYENIGKEHLELAFVAARAADPDADLYYNDYNLIWSNDKLGAVVNMVTDFQVRGIPIDGIGFQSHIAYNAPDIATIKRQFQKAVDLGIKVKITELDVRMNQNKDRTSLTGLMAEQQKGYYRDVVKAYFEIVPVDQRGGISVWGIIDGDSWLPNLWGVPDWALLFFDNFEPKPALQGFADGLTESQ